MRCKVYTNINSALLKGYYIVVFEEINETTF
jgi:hypothetical protein